MPTQAEVDAAATALDQWNELPMATCRTMAMDALVAAEAVRSQVAGRLCYEAAMVSRAHRQTDLAPTPATHNHMDGTTDQRMTQTHALLAWWKRTRDQSG